MNGCIFPSSSTPFFALFCMLTALLFSNNYYCIFLLLLRFFLFSLLRFLPSFFFTQILRFIFPFAGAWFGCCDLFLVFGMLLFFALFCFGTWTFSPKRRKSHCTSSFQKFNQFLKVKLRCGSVTVENARDFRISEKRSNNRIGG